MAIKISGTTVIDNSRNIINADDGTFDGTVASYRFLGFGAVPNGAILMWSGSIANIPTGWYLCDGSNGTPDLRNRFIVGSHSGTGTGTVTQNGPSIRAVLGGINSNYEPGDIGGLDAVKLTVAEMPGHTHTITEYDTSQSLAGGNATAGFNKPAYSENTRTTSAVGSDDYHENRPPYYALAFIMRVS